jgi:hypothetical protein
VKKRAIKTIPLPLGRLARATLEEPQTLEKRPPDPLSLAASAVAGGGGGRARPSKAAGGVGTPRRAPFARRGRLQNGASNKRAAARGVGVARRRAKRRCTAVRSVEREAAEVGARWSSESLGAVAQAHSPGGGGAGARQEGDPGAAFGWPRVVDARRRLPVAPARWLGTERMGPIWALRGPDLGFQGRDRCVVVSQEWRDTHTQCDRLYAMWWSEAAPLLGCWRCGSHLLGHVGSWWSVRLRLL